eukprot:gnl/TRDRNA2_/TRDRNA2_155993_c0_seq2.p1 gnl/TRDRNA2_/TRDRNA2_155993_c0~~gnl/TRDRNA2_/TRDRNA2_155993_c0_seq2.p1  ORF type:complete len:279 (-),score=28.13 gnl/TRDRNA2_/TRDRNA2_155993_c0_seq2:13-849(-)
MVAIVGQHMSGRSTFLRLLGHRIFPVLGHIYIPSHLRILHVSQEPMLLNLSCWYNLTYGLPTVQEIDPDHIRHILEGLQMTTVLGLVQAHLYIEQSEKTQSPRVLHLADGMHTDLHHGTPTHRSPSTSDISEMGDDEPDDEDLAGEDMQMDGSHFASWSRHANRWQEQLSYTEKAKVHLARALIMNPEVLVLQRPLHHYNHETATKIWRVLSTHISNRGFGLSRDTCELRRPRTCFFSPESLVHAREADLIWMIKGEGAVTEVLADEISRSLCADLFY